MGLWPLPRDAWIAIAGSSLLYLAYLLYGAELEETALALEIGAGLTVLAALAHPRLRDDLLRLKGLTAPVALFGVVLLVGLWTLTPWTPGGPHPVWAYVGLSPGASTVDKSSTIIELIKLLGLACFFILGALAGARDDRARFAVRLTLAAGAVFGLWAFISLQTGATQQTGGGRRLVAHFLSPNTAGTVFAVLFVLSVAEAMRDWRMRPRGGDIAPLAPIGACCMIFLVCLLATASRGAATGMLGGLVVFFLVQLAAGRLKLSKLLVGAFGVIAALLVAVALTGEQLLDRIFASQEAAIGRTAIWSAHWRAFLASPLFGYGLGTSATVNRTLISQGNFDVLWPITGVHNVYLQWLEGAGLVGAIPMFLCIGALIALTLRGALRRSRMTGLLAGLLGVDAVFLIHGATDFGLEMMAIAAFWAWLLGLQASLAQGSSTR